MTDLKREIAWLEARLAEFPDIPIPEGGDWQAWDARNRRLRAAERALREALEERGARISDTSPMRMRHLGIASTCTHGIQGLLANWIAAARRRLARSGDAA